MKGVKILQCSKTKLAKLRKQVIANQEPESPWHGIHGLNRGVYWCPRFKQLLSVCNPQCPFFKEHRIRTHHYKVCLFRFTMTKTFQKIMEKLDARSIIEAYALAQENSRSSFLKFQDRTEHAVERHMEMEHHEKTSPKRVHHRKSERVVPWSEVEISTHFTSDQCVSLCRGILDRCVNEPMKRFVIRSDRVRALKEIFPAVTVTRTWWGFPERRLVEEEKEA